MHRINFNHLYYFYVVAKEGSIKVAAEKIYVSQPTISDQLKNLEKYFQCLLFHRKNRSLVLTKEGHIALDYAEKIFDFGNELTTVLRNKSKLPKSSLDIGITYHMGQYFLYDNLLPLFKNNLLKVNVIENERHLLLAELEQAQIDVVITNSNENLSSSTKPIKLGLNRTLVVAHKSFKIKKSPFPKCLNSLPFYNYTSGSHLKYEIELFFSRNSLTPKIVGESDSIDLFQSVVENKIAFVIIPEAAKNRFCRNPDIIVLGEVEDFQTSVWAVIRKNNTQIEKLIIECQDSI